MSIAPLGTNFSEILKRNSYIFIQENTLENVVWEMASIWFLPQYVNSHGIDIVILKYSGGWINIKMSSSQ